MILVCDRECAAEYFKAGEHKFSFVDILTMLYFADAFSDVGIPVTRLQKLMHKTVAVRVDRFLPKIKVEAERCIARLEEQVQTFAGNREINFAKDMVRFVMSTSVMCFMGIELSDRAFENMYEFNQLVNTVVSSAYFLPPWLIRLIFGRRLASYRNRVLIEFEPEIEKYRADRGKNESIILRATVDSFNELTGKPLTNREIGEILLCLLFVSSENTATGLTLAIVNLVNHPEHWDRARAESRKFLRNGDVKGIMTSEYLHACVMEMARLNSHMFAILRRPREKNVLGEFFVGEVDAVGMCVQMMQVHGSAEEVFSDPTTYKPDRFLGGVDGLGDKEPMGRKIL
ncbi:sterol 14-demethylase isoform X2 [Folsomia candida]|nr:sterol 14-demethylase isoform X2 [Folsomia candida]